MEGIQAIAFLCQIYPDRKLNKVFLPLVFEQVIQIDAFYTVRKAIAMDKPLIEMSLSLRKENITKSVNNEAGIRRKR